MTIELTADQGAAEMLRTGRYRNPLRYTDGVERTDPDPFVMRYRGRYYCYSTGETQVNVSVSDDLVTWTRLDAALTVPGRGHFWAPCALYVDGVFYMYVSNRPEGSDDPHEEVLQLATSDRPEGPFTVVKRFFDTFSIDPHVVPDGDGGYVMFYSTNDVTGLDDEYVGTSIIADRLLDFDRLEGRPRPIVRPSLEEEIFEHDRFGDGRDWYTIEGATYLTRGNRAYLTYSGNAYEREDYFIGQAGAPLDAAPHELAWRKHPNDHEYAPLIRRSTDVEGTGHNSIVSAPNLVDDWIVYHGRNASDPLVPGVEQRTMRIDPLLHSTRCLITAAPSSAEQDAPSRPEASDDFSGPDLDPWWSVSEGSARPADGTLRTDASELTRVVGSTVTGAYVAEVWLRADRSDRGARAGVIVASWGADDIVEVTADAASSRLVARRWQRGVGSIVATTPLRRVHLEHWQPVRVRRVFGRVEVRIGDATTLAFEIPETPARFGLVSERTATAFSGFALTRHLDLWGGELDQAGHVFSVRPRRIADANGLAATPGRTLVLETEADTSSATVHEFCLPTSDSRVELSPWSDALRVIIEPDGYVIHGLGFEERRHPLEPPFADASSVTVRCVRAGERASIQVGRAIHSLTLADTRPATQRIELTGSRLARYEWTAHPTLHHQGNLQRSTS